MSFKVMLIVFSLAILACGQQVSITNTPIANIAPTNTGTPKTTVGITQKATVCNAGTLNFRESPGTMVEVVLTLPDGSPVTLLNDTQTASDGALWQNTEYGWANARFLC